MPGKRTIPTSTHSLHVIPKRWRCLTEEQKLYTIVRYALTHGGLAVSLNFSKDFEAYILKHPRPMEEIRKRMNAQLNAADLKGLALLLVLEFTSHNRRPHLHGIYLPGIYDSMQIQTAMRKAVGYINGHAGSRQCKVMPIFHADGWARYITKDKRISARLLKDADSSRTLWVSQPLTRLVSDHHDQALCSSSANSTSGPIPLAS